MAPSDRRQGPSTAPTGITPQRRRRAAVTVRLGYEELRRLSDIASKIHRVRVADSLELATTAEMLMLKGLLIAERELEEQLSLPDAAE